jgi:putative hemolysin
MKQVLILALMVVCLLMSACGSEPTQVPTTEPSETATREGPLESPLATAETTSEAFESPVGLPNPASQFCEDQGYQLEIREEDAGSVGYCLFPDGSECEEWAFFRGECTPGTSP